MLTQQTKITYKITNRLATSLVIEDIGVRLETGGSKLISCQTYELSKLVKQYEEKKWIGVSVYSYSYPVNLMKFPVKQHISHMVVESVKQSPKMSEELVKQESKPSSLDVSKLDTGISKFDILVSKFEGLINSIPTQIMASSGVTSADDKKKTDEPIFISSKILPDKAEVRISTSVSETGSDDFESSLRALKGRKKL